MTIGNVDPSRHCVHNNVALCALTFKIVVLAWNRSHLPSIKEAFFFTFFSFTEIYCLHCTDQSLYNASFFRWIRLTLPLKETIQDGRFDMNNFHFFT